MTLRLACSMLLAVLAVIAATGCSTTENEGIPPGPVAALLATATPTVTPTATPTPTPTATSTPFPTPLAASSVGRPPGGQVIFSTARQGQGRQELWQMRPDGSLDLLHGDVAPGQWDCAAGGRPACALVAGQDEVLVHAPLTGTLAVLDQLLVTGPAALADPLAVTATMTAAVRAPITATEGITAAVPMTVGIVSLSGDSQLLAVAAGSQVRLYDLVQRQPVATLAVTGTHALSWAPDATGLGLVFTASGGDTLALWQRETGSVRVLASMTEIGDVAWAPDSLKIAFDGRNEPGTPANQGGQSDVYVVYLASGEVRNFSEVFLENNGVAAAQQVAAWAPVWESDSQAVRYVYGIPADPGTHRVLRHPLNTRNGSAVWSQSEEGVLGLVEAPAGSWQARVVEQEDYQTVQVRQDEGEWRDVAPVGFQGLAAIAWMPAGVTLDEADPATDSTAPAVLLLVAGQALLSLDVTSGRVVQLAASCPDCQFIRAEWLP